MGDLVTSQPGGSLSRPNAMAVARSAVAALAHTLGTGDYGGQIQSLKRAFDKVEKAKKSVRSKKRKVTGIKTTAETGVSRKQLSRGGGGRKKQKTIKDRLKALENNKPKEAIHDYRNIDGKYCVWSLNQCSYTVIAGVDTALFEDAIDNLTFIDRAATPAQDSIDLRDQTIAHNIEMRDIWSELYIRNNNEPPAILDVYSLRVTDASSYNPGSVMTAQDGSFGIGDADTNIQIYPSDFPMFLNHYKILKHEKVTLSGGDSFKMYYSIKKRKYEPKMNDALATTYLKGDHIWFIRAQGVPSHGAADNNLVGTCGGKVDVLIKRKFKVCYPSDAQFYKIETNNSLDSQGSSEVAGPAVDPALATT